MVPQSQCATHQVTLATSRRATRGSHDGLLTALVKDSLPDAVYGLLQLGSSSSADLVQVWLGGAAHDQEVLFRHAAHDRVAIKQFSRLADRPYATPQRVFSRMFTKLPAAPSVITRSILPSPPAATEACARSMVRSSRGV